MVETTHGVIIAEPTTLTDPSTAVYLWIAGGLSAVAALPASVAA